MQAAGQGARATLECEGGPHTMTNVPRGYGGGNAYDIWASVSELRKYSTDPAHGYHEVGISWYIFHVHHPTFTILPHRARVPPHDHIKRQIKLARNSISNSDSFSRSLTATSISALVLSLSRSGQGQSFRLGRPHVRIAGGNLCMGGSFRSSSTSISTAYRRRCVVRSSPRPCYFCATSCPCSKKLSRSSTRDRTALFIEHIVSKMTASALLLVGAHGTLLSCSTTLSKSTAPQ